MTAPTPYLLDSNILIVLANADHEHSLRVQRWFAHAARSFATCPITEGALVRFLVRNGEMPQVAQAFLSALAHVPGHEFWADDLPYSDAELTGVVGYRQVTDAYLVALSRAHGGTLATLDEGLVSAHPGESFLIPG